MSIPSYFQVVPQHLLDPARPLSTELSPSAIAEANSAVTRVQQQAKAKETKKWGAYIVHQAWREDEDQDGKYSSENGISIAARHFSIEHMHIPYTNNSWAPPATSWKVTYAIGKIKSLTNT